MAVVNIDKLNNGIAVVYFNSNKFCINGDFCFINQHNLDLIEETPEAWNITTRNRHKISQRKGKSKVINADQPDYVVARGGMYRKDYDDYNTNTSEYLHEAIHYKMHGKYPSCTDHVNHLNIDNTDKNLEFTTQGLNRYNSFSKGYVHRMQLSTAKKHAIDVFKNKMLIHNEKIEVKGRFTKEDECCDKQFEYDKRGIRYYDCMQDMRGCEEALRDFYMGNISEDDLLRIRLKSYIDNPWYVLRFNLYDRFSSICNKPVRGIDYILYKNSFMQDKNTGLLLCPI